ncbi:MAG: hypothetical protein IKZ87_04255 [Actinomycetaceae bacterium]|nr:hypothetical protein [Actinomycetaceae bacterium]
MGFAIKSAMQVHGEFAAVQPHLDEIFARTSDCFKEATTIFDLSFAIPSLWDIVDVAIQAVKDYAVQQICNLAYEIPNKIRSAMGEVLTTIKQLGETGDISIANLSSSLFTGSSATDIINSISFAGKAKDRSGQTYTINTNGLGLTNMCIKDSKCDTNENLSNQSEWQDELNEINKTIGKLKADMDLAWNALITCQKNAATIGNMSDSACSNQQTKYDQLKKDYDTKHDRMVELQDKLSNLECQEDTQFVPCEEIANPSNNNATKKSASAAPKIMPMPQQQQATTTKSTSQKKQSSSSTNSRANPSWLSSLGGLLSGGEK